MGQKKRFIIVAILIIFTLLEGAFLHYQETTLAPLRQPAAITQDFINSVIDSLKPFRRFGLVAQNDGDMGDTLQRTGSYYTLLKYLGREKDDLGRPIAIGYDEDLKKMTVSPGYYRRANREGDWSSNPENTSRDQMMALHSAVVLFKDTERAKELMASFSSRLFFNQNIRHNDSYPGQASYQWKFPDPPAPMQLSLMLRGLNQWWLYPAIFTLDLALLVDLTMIRRLNSRELWDSDIKSVPIIIAANSYLPTPWSRLALRLYLDQRNDIEDRIRYYNQVRFNGIAPLAELYVITLDQMVRPQKEALSPLALLTGF